MYRIFSVLLVSLLAYIPLTALAGNADMTQSSYMLNLAPMDPLGSSHSSNIGSGVWVLATILGRIADLLLFTIPIIAVFSFLVAGYFYIFSAWDSEKTGRAKTIIKWNIIAMLIGFLSYAIISLIARIFS